MACYVSADVVMATSLLLFIIVLFSTVVIGFCALVADRTGHAIVASVIAAVAWLFAGVGLVLLVLILAVP